MLLVWMLLPLCLIGQGSGAYPYAIPFEKHEIPVYAFEALSPQVALRMEYAASVIENPEEWLQARQRGIPRRIDLVFTKYPIDTTDWFTAYQRLLHDRLRSLFSIDPLLEQQDIEWRLVLQTNCQSEEQARKYFHGFVIQYEVTHPLRMRQLSTSADVERVITGLVLPRDSSILNIMDRNRQWKNVLVIMDWTGSMYDYGAQVVLWHKLNMETSGIKHLILFNDGDRKATWQKQIGRTGGIYHAQCNDLVEVVETISDVMRNGYGGDTPENDLEAVLKGVANLDGFDEIVLIADNRSQVRDMPLLNNIKKPVRVVLCGKGRSQIHPDYLQIAFKTHGSIHTVEEDIMAMGKLKEGDIIDIEGIRYKVRAGELERFE